MKYLLIIIIIILSLLKISKAQTWYMQSSGTSTNLTSVFFVNEFTGWSVGWNLSITSVILKTTNSGNNWFSQSVPSGVLFTDKVYMVNSNTGFISTRTGNILKTTDGGNNWLINFTGPGTDLLSVKFINEDTGFACGYPGIIYKTTNAGAVWSQQSSGATNFLYDIAFQSADTVFIGSQDGLILFTYNGGMNWNQLTIPGTPQLNSIVFTDELTGYTGGLNIYKTTNRGVNWFNTGSYSLIYSLYFLDSYTGFFATNTGFIRKTTNGGSSWTAQTSGTSNLLRSVFFVNPSKGYIAGANGTILHTNDQPLPVSMRYFNGNISGNNVLLKWSTDWEMNNKGFDVERSTAGSSGNSNWQKIGYVRGCGTINVPVEYEFSDIKLQSAVYKYRLKQIDFNGNYEYHDLSVELKIEKPAGFFVSQNYPNPSNPLSKIDVQIPVSGNFILAIYDVSGKTVHKETEYKQSGFYTFKLKGSDLASGVYFYQVIIEGEGKRFEDIKKFILVK